VVTPADAWPTRRRWARRGAVLAALLVAFLVGADTGPRLTQSADAAASEALAMTREMLAADMPEGLVQWLRPGLVQGFIDADHLPIDVAEHLFTDVLEPQLRGSLPLLERSIARVWTSQFTPDEIADLHAYLRDRAPERTRAFLATPLGQKYEIVSPSILAAQRALIRTWTAMACRAAFAAHARELRRLGLDPATGDRLVPAPGPGTTGGQQVPG